MIKWKIATWLSAALQFQSLLNWIKMWRIALKHCLGGNLVIFQIYHTSCFSRHKVRYISLKRCLGSKTRYCKGFFCLGRQILCIFCPWGKYHNPAAGATPWTATAGGPLIPDLTWWSGLFEDNIVVLQRNRPNNPIIGGGQCFSPHENTYF